MTDVLARHPVTYDWQRFIVHQPELFLGSAEGDYLRNRLQAAFEEGWVAASRRVTSALAAPVEAEATR